LVEILCKRVYNEYTKFFLKEDTIMPGPGGGGHGGGFGGGGGHRGGGHGGGGHRGGGGFHGGPHYHHHWHGWWGPHFYGYGGGCLGMFMSFVFLPLILIGIAVIVFFSVVMGAFSAATSGGEIHYENTDKLYAYEAEQYDAIFNSNQAGYEDGLMVVFLTYDNNQTFDYYCWNGNHVNKQIVNAIANYTSLGTYLDDNYYYRLGDSVAKFLSDTADSIDSLGVSSFTCSEQTHTQTQSKYINKTGISSVDNVDLQTAIDKFTETTGITLAVVFEEADEVFGVDYTEMVIGIVTIVVLVGAAVAFIVFSVRKYKQAKASRSGGDGGSSGGGYGGDDDVFYGY
jgi:uncharacterized membrane protein